jgi:hypothetical protein
MNLEQSTLKITGWNFFFRNVICDEQNMMNAPVNVPLISQFLSLYTTEFAPNTAFITAVPM